MKMANTTSFGRLKHNTIRNKNTAESNRLVALGGGFNVNQQLTKTFSTLIDN